MYYDNLETHRVNAGIRVSELEKASGVNRATIKRVERHNCCRQETLAKIINALNDIYYLSSGNPINIGEEITKKKEILEPNYGELK